MSKDMNLSNLSKADAKVLAQVFDPESGPAKAEVIVDPTLVPDRHISTPALLAQLREAEKKAIALIEQFESSSQKDIAFRNRTYLDSLAILDDIVRKNPLYASARNNRAQVRRWRFGDGNLLCRSSLEETPEDVATAGAIVSDLKMAILLASPDSPHNAVSPTQGRLLAQAYTQLGALYFAASKDIGSKSDSHIAPDDFVDWDQNRFEEEASRSFYLGGMYGNEVAKALAVHTNPHARLCGSIVKEAMRKEFADCA